MNTELSLTDTSGEVLAVSVNELTPMGFECVVAGNVLERLKDKTGRFREFDLMLNDQSECVGHCRVHSTRRICKDKAAICLRFDDSALLTYQRLRNFESSYHPVLRRA